MTYAEWKQHTFCEFYRNWNSLSDEEFIKFYKEYDSELFKLIAPQGRLLKGEEIELFWANSERLNKLIVGKE